MLFLTITFSFISLPLSSYVFIKNRKHIYINLTWRYGTCNSFFAVQSFCSFFFGSAVVVFRRKGKKKLAPKKIFAKIHIIYTFLLVIKKYVTQKKKSNEKEDNLIEAHKRVISISLRVYHRMLSLCARAVVFLSSSSSNSRLLQDISPQVIGMLFSRSRKC